ncbi:hypothetical protein GBAR_LOCUS10875, partial [Geodia barretti]
MTGADYGASYFFAYEPISFEWCQIFVRHVLHMIHVPLSVALSHGFNVPLENHCPADRFFLLRYLANGAR